MSNPPTTSSNAVPLAKKASLSSLRFKKHNPSAAPSATEAPPPPPSNPSRQSAPAPSSRATQPPPPSSSYPTASSRSRRGRKSGMTPGLMHKGDTPSPASTPPPASTAPPQPSKERKKVKVPPGHSIVMRWGDVVVFGYGTDYAPSNPDGLVARGLVTTDGYWGRNEYTLYPQPFNVHAPQMALIELPTPATQTWLEFFEIKESDLDANALPKEYILGARMHEKLRDLSWKYRGDFDEVVKLIQQVCSQGALPVDSVEYDVVSNMAIPKAMASNMTKRYGTLQAAKLREVNKKKTLVRQKIEKTEEQKERERKEDEEKRERGEKVPTRATREKVEKVVDDSGELVPALRSMADMVACVRAWQRAAREISAFIDMSAAILSKAKHPAAAEWLERRQRHDVSPRRGSILMDEDVERYYPFLRSLNVPTYVRVPVEDVISGVLRIVEPGPYRSSMQVDRTLTDIEQRDLPLAWYQPKNVPSHLVELVARGSLPLDHDYGCADEEEKEPYQESDLILSKKRKAQGMEAEAKRQRLAKEQAEERRDAAFHRKHPNMGASAETYRYFIKHAAPLRRFFDMKNKPRPPFLPAPTQLYSEAEAQLINNLGLMPPATRKGEDSLATFVPPVHLIANAEVKRGRQAKLIMHLITLMPLLLARPALAQRDPDAGIRRFGVTDWKDLLIGKTYKKARFWEDGKNGGDLLFGKDFARLQAQPTARPPWGTLPCRNAPEDHEPTIELVENDSLLAAGVMFSLNQWRQLHWLSHLAEPADLEAAGVKKITDKFGVHYTPDFMSTALDIKTLPPIKNALPGKKNKNKPRKMKTVVCMIRQIVRRKWLENFASFFSRTAHAKELDSLKMGSEGRMHTSAGLITANTQAWAKQEKLERHLHLRYVFTSLKCGQMPVEFQVLPHGDFHRCRECREREAREVRATYGAPGMTEAYNDYDLDDEGEEEYY
ncbi:hypothetical protein PENSPDRAFT_687022 [Peniophora sp. CONT]|nr:hypothetical protein PENSPDRAFT_687022 [Peniophora sp. CONT]